MTPPELRDAVIRELKACDLPINEETINGYLLGMCCGLMEENETLRAGAVNGFTRTKKVRSGD